MALATASIMADKLGIGLPFTVKTRVKCLCGPHLRPQFDRLFPVVSRSSRGSPTRFDGGLDGICAPRR